MEAGSGNGRCHEGCGAGYMPSAPLVHPSAGVSRLFIPLDAARAAASGTICYGTMISFSVAAARGSFDCESREIARRRSIMSSSVFAIEMSLSVAADSVRDP